MPALYIFLGIVGGLTVVTLAAALVCYFMTFYSPKRKKLDPDEYDIPEGEIYEVYRDAMVNWQKATRQMSHEDIEIKSRDGLTLRGKYYEFSPDAPLEIMFHGYKGNAERDLSGGVDRCFRLGRSVIIVSQRAHGDSDGHTISFGIKECLDCLEWVKYANSRFGNKIKIILTGISMGASTVLMAGGEELPDNVVCILADCGYSSPKEIIKKVVHDMHLPVSVVYPFIRLGGLIYGRFDLESNSPIEAMKRCKVPVIFVHGEGDDFVPCDMSREMYEVCQAPKAIYTVPGAGHGLAFPADIDGYIKEVKAFEANWKDAI